MSAAPNAPFVAVKAATAPTFDGDAVDTVSAQAKLLGLKQEDGSKF